MRLGNKLTVRHSNFKNQKMKTGLAAQTLSNSTANSMTVCEKLGFENFEGASHTAKFFKLMDKVFDLTNSRTGSAGYKAPLTKKNERLWSPIFDDCIKMLKSISHYDPKKDENVLLIESQKGTFARGLIVTLTSIKGLMKYYVEEKQLLQYFTTINLNCMLRNLRL